jgi:thioredoxin-like negative regulator of GroEL
VPDDALLESLRRAVESDPGDTALRLHLAEVLVGAGLGDEALPHLNDLRVYLEQRKLV